MPLHNNNITTLMHFIQEQADYLNHEANQTNLVTEILDAIERILSTNGINEPDQVSYFINEGKAYLTQDPNGQKLFINLQSSITKKESNQTATLLLEFYEWLNASFEEIEGI